MYIVMLLIIAGCSKQENQSQQAQGLIKIGNYTVTQEQVDLIVDAQVKIQNLNAKTDKDKIIALKKDIKNKLIDNYLLVTEAQKRSINVDTAEVDKRVDEITQMFNSTEPAKLSLLAQGYTKDNIKEKITQEIMIKNMLAGMVNVTEQEVVKQFSEHTKDYALYEVKQVTASSNVEADQKINDGTLNNQSIVLMPKNLLPKVLSDLLDKGSIPVEPQKTVISSNAILITKIITEKQASLDNAKEGIKKDLEAIRQIEAAGDLVKKLREENHIDLNVVVVEGDAKNETTDK